MIDVSSQSPAHSETVGIIIGLIGRELTVTVAVDSIAALGSSRANQPIGVVAVAIAFREGVGVVVGFVGSSSPSQLLSIPSQPSGAPG